MIRILLTLALLATVTAARANDFWLGADVSGTTELERRGVQLYNAAGQPRDNFMLMKELGMNAVRLRVWVNPKRGDCNKEDVLGMALRAKALGFALMIDFHYSDWWADPAKQNIPEAWKDMSYEQMKQALAEHTRATLQLLKDYGVDVKWVQVGNETTDGFLWDVGRASTHMDQYAGLTDAGYGAVKAVYPQAVCIVHVDCGCDMKRYRVIFDGLERHHARYDMIGMSVYPYWDMDTHLTTSDDETLTRVIANIKQLHKLYGRDVMIVETGYEARRPEAGRAFMQRLITQALRNTDGHCRGVFYWAPEADAGGHYPLGAFDNHRPTVILDPFNANNILNP